MDLPDTSGDYPDWRSTQCVCKRDFRELRDLGIDSEILTKNETLNKKIRTAEKQKVPLIIVLGDNEVANRSVALRDRRAREQRNLGLSEFLDFVQNKLNEVNF